MFENMLIYDLMLNLIIGVQNNVTNNYQKKFQELLHAGYL
jgi:hypothetical protein